MKTQSLSFVVPSPRCSHRTAAGRRCRQLSADRQPGLCHHHRAVQKQKEAHDHSRALLSQSQGFQTAQGINHSLGNLYELLAANYISARRAAVLAYINSLQLRTLPAIDADQAAGITGLAAPTAISVEPVPQSPDVSPAPSAESEPDSEAESDSPKAVSPEAVSTEMNADHPSASAPNASAPPDPAPPTPYRSYWATLADTNKKPS